MKSGPVPHQEAVEPQYPGLLASIAMVFIGWHWLAGHGIELLWAATGMDEQILWPLVHLGASLFIAYACYAMQPAKGMVRYFAIEPIPLRAAARVPIFSVGVYLAGAGALGFLYQSVAAIGLLPDDLSGPSEPVDAQRPSWLLLALVIAPFGEELVMRGLVLQGLLQRYGPMASVVVSAAIFGVFHGNAQQAIGATVSGIFLGLVFVRTRSLWVPMLMHSSHNAFVAMAHSLTKPEPIRSDEPSSFPVVPFTHEGWLGELALVYLILLCITAAGAWLLISSYRAFEREFHPATQPAVAGSPVAPPREAKLTEFKARRPAPPPDSG